MRHGHCQSPLHNIEYWTGSFFRPAALWEVGTYILVPHHNEMPLANCLNVQKEILEQIQRSKDDEEQAELGGSMPNARGVSSAEGVPATAMPLGECEVADEDSDDEVVDESSSEDEVLGSLGDYLTHGLGKVPTQDAFSNQYVRIVHINGIHHRALVTCACQGAEQVHADLMYCRLVPATFVRYQTLFTAGVLDDFRVSNLECKVSAYQYFQKLRRITNPTSPHRTPNLYQELLRMARLWRWLKKKKWYGHAFRGSEPTESVPGEMALFCPACPQPGINLPDEWRRDGNR